jgi:RNA polymerase sigma-70 factor, ECF subfamily
VPRGFSRISSVRPEGAEPVGDEDATIRSPTAAPGSALLDEPTLVARAGDGDPRAFELLIDRYQAPIFRYTYRMLGDRGSAEDVVQDTFVAVWRGLPGLTEPAAFRGWLYQIATRRAFDVLRVRRPEAGLPMGTEEPLIAVTAATSTTVDPAQVTVERAQVQALQQALMSLPLQQRAAWSMQNLEGLSYDEIAVALSLPVSTVRGRIARARHSLAGKMWSWR